MRVAIIGGTGFVGSYLVDALVDSGHDARLLVRPGSEDKVRRDTQTVVGDISSVEALHAVLDGYDAVIYCVGLLREFPRRGITFETTQYQGVVDTVAAAKKNRCETHAFDECDRRQGPWHKIPVHETPRRIPCV